MATRNTETRAGAAGLLHGKVAIVTGAASGIGRAIAHAYAEAGASVVASDVDEPGGQQTLAGIRERGARGLFVRADISSAADNEALVRAALGEFGALHIACNNAGIGGAIARAGDYPIESWDRVLAVNLSGVFYGMRHQIPALLAAGGGAIVNVGSILSQVGFRSSCAYVAAKHGLIGLTQTAALEYAPQGLRINAIGPGFIRTPMIENAMTPEALTALEALHPMGRLGESGEVAELALWLSSPRASFVTGSYYPIDGGYLAQ